MHPSESFLHAEADALDLEAARIEQAMKHDAPAAVAEMCLERASERVGPMLNEEAATISAVCVEHAGNEPDCPAKAEAAARNQLFADYERLQDDLANGRDCHDDLQAVVQMLHMYASIGRSKMAPFCAQHLDEEAWREADARIRSYGRPGIQYVNPSALA